MPEEMKIFTIGYNRYNQVVAVARLKQLGINRIIDIRLWPNSIDILKAQFSYARMPEFAPERSIISDYMDDGNWTKYEQRFKQLMRARNPLKSHKPEDFKGAVLMCAERSAARCHRRLVAEMIHDKFGLQVVHL